MTPAEFNRCDELLAEPALGFRQWHVDGDRLIALNGYEWPVGDLIAHCRRSPQHHAPEASCECGFYACHEVDVDWQSEGTVWGVVIGWGRLEVHLDGFRSEHMRPVALISETRIDANSAALERVATRYALAVLNGSDAAAFGAEFGAPIPLSARPRHVAGLLKRLTRLIHARESLQPGPLPQKMSRATVTLDVLCADPSMSLESALHAMVGEHAAQPLACGWDRRLRVLREVLRRELAACDAGCGNWWEHELLHCLEAAHGVTVASTLARLESGVDTPASQILHPNVVAYHHPRSVQVALSQLSTPRASLRPNICDGLAAAGLQHFDELDPSGRERVLSITSGELFERQRLRLEREYPGELGQALSTLPWWTHPRPEAVTDSQLQRNLTRDGWQFHFGCCDQRIRDRVGAAALARRSERGLRDARDPVHTLQALMWLDPHAAAPQLTRLTHRAMQLGPQHRARFRRWLGRSRLAHVLDSELVVDLILDGDLRIADRVYLLVQRPDLAERVVGALWDDTGLTVSRGCEILGVPGQHGDAFVQTAVRHAPAAISAPAPAVRLGAVLACVFNDELLETARGVAVGIRYPARLRWLAVANLEAQGEVLEHARDPVLDRYRSPSCTREPDLVRTDMSFWMAES